MRTGRPVTVDLSGRKFGRITVIRRASRKGVWICACECGIETEAATGNLNSGRTRSCGCGRTTDLLGQIFSRLTVIARAKRDRKFVSHSARWICRCECGKEIEASAQSLRSGDCLSCGCYQADRSRELNTKHGHAKKGKRSVEHQTWSMAKQRCTNPNNNGYPEYGGRGITFFEGWKNDFDAFLRHIGPKPTPQHSLDRIDNERGYEPGNVRWATKTEQINNRRVASKIWPELQKHRRRVLPTLMLMGLLTASHREVPV